MHLNYQGTQWSNIQLTVNKLGRKETASISESTWRYLEGPPYVTARIVIETLAVQRNSREAEIRQAVEILGRQFSVEGTKRRYKTWSEIGAMGRCGCCIVNNTQLRHKVFTEGEGANDQRLS